MRVSCRCVLVVFIIGIVNNARGNSGGCVLFWSIVFRNGIGVVVAVVVPIPVPLFWLLHGACFDNDVR